MKLLDGLEVVQYVKERQAKQVRNLRQTWHTVPRLAIVQTIDNSVIDTYVRLKRQYAEDILIEFEHHKVSQDKALAVISELNQRSDVHGIIVQLPLADPSQTEAVLTQVAPDKDVDGLAPDSKFDSATPMAINWLLAAYGIDLSNKKIALVGHGRLVGAPLAKMWSESDYSVMVFDENSQDMKGQLKSCDLIVTATGVPGLITSDMISRGATVVDAGTASEQGKIVGDLSPDVRERDDLIITPVKGGVGPLTIAALFDNVITAARRTTSKS